MNAIEVNKLTKKFGKFTSVDAISFSVREGEVFGFLGANGAGKSTTIRMLIGILEPTSGDAMVAGYSIVKDPNKVKENIGYMSQRFSLYNDISVEENINFFAGIYGLSGKLLAERKEWVLRMANLEKQKNIITGSLPGGIKQRLALGTAVIHKPKIVFLDEPTSGVDPISRRAFWELINLLAEEGITVLVTTHYLEEAEFCGNIILMNAGKLIAEGTPKYMKTGYIQENIYEIQASNPADALEFVSKAPFVHESNIFGNNIHLFIPKEIDAVTSLTNYFAQSTFRLNSIKKVSATLEDVFIHLLEKDAQ